MADERSIAAVVLAGGQGRRLGGADKPGLRVAARTLASLVVAAAIEAGATPVVLVGPRRTDLGAGPAGPAGPVRVQFTREQPPGGGPVPALRAGLGLVTAPWTFLLAADLPFLTGSVLRELRSAATSGLGAGAVLTDDTGRPQWLVSCWPTAKLGAAIEGYRGTSLRELLAPLPHADVCVLSPPGEPPYWLDCDTLDDLAAARRWAHHLAEE